MCQIFFIPSLLQAAIYFLPIEGRGAGAGFMAHPLHIHISRSRKRQVLRTKMLESYRMHPVVF
jgi:hypothetical protein